MVSDEPLLYGNPSPGSQWPTMQQVEGSGWEPGHILSQHGAQVGVGDRALLPEDLGARFWPGLGGPPTTGKAFTVSGRTGLRKLLLASLPSSHSSPKPSSYLLPLYRASWLHILSPSFIFCGTIYIKKLPFQNFL